MHEVRVRDCGGFGLRILVRSLRQQTRETSQLWGFHHFGYGLWFFLLGSYPTPHVRILVIEWIRLSIV